MRFMTNNGPLLRAIGVLSAVGVMVTGVTFAALQSQQATLAGNSIQSATADLRIGTSASTFDASRTGFSFKDIVPGGPAMPTDGNTFYLKNYGTATMTLKLAIGTTPTNLANVDLTKVKLLLSRVENGVEQPAQTITLKSAIDSGLTLSDPIGPSTIVQYKLRVAMDADAFTGTAATIGGIDLVFSGTAAN
jgi:hypothetical protein